MPEVRLASGRRASCSWPCAGDLQPSAIQIRSRHHCGPATCNRLQSGAYSLCPASLSAGGSNPPILARRSIEQIPLVRTCHIETARTEFPGCQDAEVKTRIWVALLIFAVGLWVAGIATAVNNPTISHTSGGDYTCLAPYDTALFGADNLRGDRPDGQDIAKRCDLADRDRFVVAGGLAGVGVVLGLGGVLHLMRQRRPPMPS